jgi:hypothetical protein
MAPMQETKGMAIRAAAPHSHAPLLRLSIQRLFMSSPLKNVVGESALLEGNHPLLSKHRSGQF